MRTNFNAYERGIIMEHARLGCSNVQWPKCAGSIRECKNYFNQVSSAAIDGTGSHELLELVLNGGKQVSTKDYINRTIKVGHKDKPDGWVIEEDRARRVQIAIDYIAKRLKELGENAILLTEHKTNPGERYGRDDWWGTCDVTLFNESTIEVIDYKDGWIYVPVTTSQLVGCGIGQIDIVKNEFNCDIQTIVKTIIQPRNDDSIRSITHTIKQNDELGQILADAAKNTDDPNAPLTPGDHCRWCSHIDNCNVRNEIATTIINGSVNPQDMTEQQLSQANDAIPMIKSFIEALEREAITRIEDGKIIDGYRIVNGKLPHLKWLNEDEAISKLRAMRFKLKDYMMKKIITPTQAFKRLELTDRQIATLDQLTLKGKNGKKLKKVLNDKPTDNEMFGITETKKPEKETLTKDVDKSINSQGVKNEQNHQTLVMTGDIPYERFIGAGWTDDLLIAHGHATKIQDQ